MSIKIKLVHLSLLFGLFLGGIMAVPMTMTEQQYAESDMVLALGDTGAVLMGDCAGDGGSCT